MESKRKIRLGQVVSDKMDKTVVVAVETPKRHPLYKKTIKRVVKYKAHDEKNKCQVGDKVRIVETRPLSRDKRWRVAEIVTKAEVVEILPEEITEGEIAEVKPEEKAKEEVAKVKPEKKAKGKEEVTEVKPEKKTKGKEEVTEAEPEEKAKGKEKVTKVKPEKKAKGEASG
jgi:small subunit ribosomal protein S17